MTKPDPSPFLLKGNATGVLLIHGFPGSTTDVRRLGTFLHERGLTVSAPLLPGHGTCPADLNRVRWQAWTDRAEEALAQLSTRCQRMFVGGLSLGSLITTYTAAHHPELAGIMLYSPAFVLRSRLIHLVGILKHVMPFRPPSESDAADPTAAEQLCTYDVIPTYGAHEVYKLTKAARRLLPEVGSPALIVHTARDSQIAPRSVRLAYNRIGSRDKRVVTLSASGHNVLVDVEWETVAQETLAFIEAH